MGIPILAKTVFVLKWIMVSCLQAAMYYTVTSVSETTRHGAANAQRDMVSTRTTGIANVGNTWHYNDVIMSAMVSQITSLTIIYSTVYSVADQRKHQSPASRAFVRGVHRWSANSPQKGPVTRKMFPFDDVIMIGSKILRSYVTEFQVQISKWGIGTKVPVQLVYW